MKIENGKLHHYKATIKWTGNKGEGTKTYQSYSRRHIISIDNKNDIVGSSDPAFRGEDTKHNPEELFVSSLSACHMLWFLHLCAEAAVVVTDYIDNAIGIMTENENGSGHFTSVTLHPVVAVAEHSMVQKANELHKKAHEFCFISNSVNFPVYCEPKSFVK